MNVRKKNTKKSPKRIYNMRYVSFVARLHTLFLMPMYSFFRYLWSIFGKVYHVILEGLAIQILLFGGIVVAFIKAPAIFPSIAIMTTQSVPSSSNPPMGINTSSGGAGPASCNMDGVCDVGAGESASVCYWDCRDQTSFTGAGAPCDIDNVCDPAETQESCPFDCNRPARGGPCHTNGVCEIRESDSCADCQGSIASGAACGNTYCNEAGGENADNCPADCCSANWPGGGAGPIHRGCNLLSANNIGVAGCHYCGPNIHGPYNPGVNSMSCPYGIAGDVYQEICTGGVDDDANGMTDCADIYSCADDPDCIAAGGGAGGSSGGGNTSSGGTAGPTGGGSTGGGSTGGGSSGGAGSTFSGCSAQGGALSPLNIPGKNLTIVNANGAARTIESVFGSEYLFIDASASTCPNCVNFANSHNNDNAFQQRLSNSTCSFVTLTTPNDITSWTNVIGGPTTFIGQRSFSTTQLTAVIEQWAGLVGIPAFMIMNRNGQIVSASAGGSLPPLFDSLCTPCSTSGGGGGTAGNGGNGTTCTDGIKNGLETDVDCGGLCAPCGAGDQCADNTDCVGGTYCNTSAVQGSVFTTQSLEGDSPEIAIVDDMAQKTNEPQAASTTPVQDTTIGDPSMTKPGATVEPGTQRDTTQLTPPADQKPTENPTDQQLSPSPQAQDVVPQNTNLNTDQHTNQNTNQQLVDQQAQEDANRQESIKANEQHQVAVEQEKSAPQAIPVTVVNDVNTSSSAKETEYLPGAYIVKFKTNTDTSRRLVPDFDASHESSSDYIASLQRIYNSPREEQYNVNQQLAVQRMVVKNIVQNGLQEVRKMFVSTTSDAVANTYELKIDKAGETKVVQEFQNDENVDYIERVPLYTVDVNDTYANNTSMRYLSKVEADKAWAAGGHGSSSVVVAVIDNAFDTSHPDLGPNLLPGYDVANGDNDVNPPASRGQGMPGAHGTHTAGSAGAVTDNSMGVAAISNNISVLPVKATLDSYPPKYITHYLEAIDYVGGRSDVNIVSMSFGGPGFSQTMQNIISAHGDKLRIAAAGNDGSNSTDNYPANYDGVFAVAASTQNDTKAGFSNYGSRVDITAPGVDIMSTMPGTHYGSSQGTSMATPVVASLAALLRSAGAGSAGQVESIITSTSDAMPASQSFCNGWLGAGRINACKALNAVGITCTSAYGANGGPSSCGSSSQPSCGDGMCNGTETCSSCSQDCGSCPNGSGGTTGGGQTGGGTGGPICGDGVCQAPETCTTCSQDCTTCPIPGSGGNSGGGNSGGGQTGGGTNGPVCGDGVCQTPENCSTCSQDCNTCPTPGSGGAGGVPAAGICTPIQGGTGSGTGTPTGPTGGSGTVLVQLYPLIKRGVTTSKVSMQAGDTATWTLIFSYETFAALYPTAQLLFEVNLPTNLSYVTDSDQATFTNGYGGVTVAGKKLTFKVNVSQMQPTVLQAVKKYQGSVTFGVSANGSVSLPDSTYPSDAGCYGLAPANASYEGVKTCSTSTAPGDAVRQKGGAGGGNGTGANSCIPSGDEASECDDSKDNDCDGKIDCSDPNCITSSICKASQAAQLCGNGKQERIYGEQCDNGTKNGTGEPVGSGQIVCSTSCQILKGANLCGNSFINGTEECDDGNLTDNDGCNRACAVEGGWRCDAQEPSECTDKLCREHGEFYTATDPYGLCCNGLSSQIIGSGANKVMVCFDPSLGSPECRIDEEEGKVGWQVRTSANQRAFIKEAACDGAGQLIGTGSGIYYRHIWTFLNETQLSCQYTDVDYSKVDFADIKDSRQRTAILALKDSCIVKGVGSSGRLFLPDNTMRRAEFIKLMVKTIYLGRDIDFSDELSIKIVRTPYSDVPVGYWASSYIAEAEKLGLLNDLETRSGGKRLLFPNKSITKDEAIRIIQKRTEGYPMARSMMENLLGRGTLPTRAAIGDLVTRKYIDKFLPYYYLQGSNRQYFEGLLNQLAGKNKKAQRDFIVQEIAKLEKVDPKQFQEEYDFHSFWILTYLKGLISR